MSTDPARALLQFFGGRVCLDFANTMDWRTSAAPQELLPDYATLLYWSGKRGTLPPPAIAKLRAQARRRAAAAARVLEDARILRMEIWKAAEALCRGEAAQPAALNRRLAALPAQPRLIRRGPGYVYDLPGKSLVEPLWPVLWSLSALLTSLDAARLGFCQAEGCGWFFVDESPNHARSWCSSEVCGNRERARRAYARRRIPSTAL
jgi:predicted RNA-binding Zn ribbon-like protein